MWSLTLGPVARLRARLPAPGLHSDDAPRFEFVSARSAHALRRRFGLETWPRLASHLVPGDPDALWAGLPAGAARTGQLLARANQLAVAGRPEALRPLWAELRELLPAHLLAQRDPSISSVWPGD